MKDKIIAVLIVLLVLFVMTDGKIFAKTDALTAPRGYDEIGEPKGSNVSDFDTKKIETSDEALKEAFSTRTQLESFYDPNYPVKVRLLYGGVIPGKCGIIPHISYGDTNNIINALNSSMVSQFHVKWENNVPEGETLNFCTLTIPKLELTSGTYAMRLANAITSMRNNLFTENSVGPSVSTAYAEHPNTHSYIANTYFHRNFTVEGIQSGNGMTDWKDYFYFPGYDVIFKQKVDDFHIQNLLNGNKAVSHHMIAKQPWYVSSYIPDLVLKSYTVELNKDDLDSVTMKGVIYSDTYNGMTDKTGSVTGSKLLAIEMNIISDAFASDDKNISWAKAWKVTSKEDPAKKKWLIFSAVGFGGDVPRICEPDSIRGFEGNYGFLDRHTFVCDAIPEAM